MELSNKTVIEIKEAACKAFPNEMCGMVVDGEFVQLENTHDDPQNSFSMETVHDDYDAIIHSHTMTKIAGRIDPRSPSELDQEQYFVSGVPWGITATDGNAAMDIAWKDDNDRMDLVGRPFVYGVTDCWSLIRDYYHLHGIELIDTVRSWEWESNPEKDYYGDLWQSEGFYRVNSMELQRGDMIFFKIKGNRYNHAAIYLEDNKILHHLMGKLSSEDSAARWMGSAGLFLRHKDWL